MATSRIEIVNGLFFGTDKNFDTNGYAGTVNPDGSIFIERVKGNGGVKGIIYPDGAWKFTDSTGAVKRGKATLDNSGKVNGTLGVHASTGVKYAYFRDGGFQKFLSDHGITAVKHADPNREYSLREAFHAGGYCVSALFSDGEVVEEQYTDLRSQEWQDGVCGYNPDLYKGEYTKLIKGATWSIVCQGQRERDSVNCSVILYTLKDPVTLSLPQVTRNGQWKAE